MRKCSIYVCRYNLPKLLVVDVEVVTVADVEVVTVADVDVVTVANVDVLNVLVADDVDAVVDVGAGVVVASVVAGVERKMNIS